VFLIGCTTWFVWFRGVVVDYRSKFASLFVLTLVRS
jgi:hypothetical protein